MPSLTLLSVLKQVQELMADENDPNPEVTMEPDSDDDMTMDSEPSVASMLAAQQRSGQPPSGYSDGSTPRAGPCRSTPGSNSTCATPHPGSSDAPLGSKEVQNAERKKYKKRAKGVLPMRQSSRITHRKTYSDRINKRRTTGPRRSRQQDESYDTQGNHEEQESVRRQVRPTRLSKYVRNAMIKAMVDMQDNSGRYDKRSVKWNPGGYESDNDADDVMEEMENGSSWVVELPQDQQDTLALLERESIVDNQRPLVSSSADEGDVSMHVDGTLPVSSSLHDAVVTPEGSSSLPLTESRGLSSSALSEVGLAEPSSGQSSVVLGRANGVLHATPTVGSATSGTEVGQPVVYEAGGTGLLAEPAVQSGFLSSAKYQIPPRPEVLELDSDSENEPTVASLLAARQRMLQS